MMYIDRNLATYLKEIGKIPLLTKEEEIELARKNTEESHRELVRHNLKFIVNIAKKYKNRGLPLPDLINEGNIGLMKAVERYDYRRDVKFISYAVWWIRQGILTAIANTGNDIRIPINQIQKLGDDEIKRYRPISLETEIGEDSYLIDFIRGYDEPIDKNLEQGDLKKIINNTLQELNPREREIIIKYFGLNGDKRYTLEEIGSKFGVTRERIRQIKKKALLRMKCRGRKYGLSGSLN